MRVRSILRSAWAHALALSLAVPAAAVIIDSGDGSGNTTAPVPDDPGWSNVGTIGALTGVYLGGRFVLTAAHVGPGNIVLDGETYLYVPGTAVQLDNGEPPPNTTYADLLMFQIYPEPPLPALEIADLSPAVLTPLILIGHGVDRGPPTSWNFIDGYYWGSAQSMRWGTNAVSGAQLIELSGTASWSIETRFDEGGSDHEAQAAFGDSGGASFAPSGPQWELAGILFAILPFPGQPSGTALYGNFTYSVDLSFYRDQILDVMAMPEPSAGVGPGAAFVALLARRRQAFARSTTRR
jgi:hypothetical protein